MYHIRVDYLEYDTSPDFFIARTEEEAYATLTEKLENLAYDFRLWPSWYRQIGPGMVADTLGKLSDLNVFVSIRYTEHEVDATQAWMVTEGRPVNPVDLRPH